MITTEKAVEIATNATNYKVTKMLQVDIFNEEGSVKEGLIPIYNNVYYEIYELLKPLINDGDSSGDTTESK